jgi:hypothetical protein
VTQEEGDAAGPAPEAVGQRLLDRTSLPSRIGDVVAQDPAQRLDPKGDPQGPDTDDHEGFPEPKPGERERERDGQQIATRDEPEPSNRGVRESSPDLPEWPMEQATREADEDPRNEGEPHRGYPDQANQLGLLKHVVASVDRGCRPRQSQVNFGSPLHWPGRPSRALPSTRDGGTLDDPIHLGPARVQPDRGRSL